MTRRMVNVLRGAVTSAALLVMWCQGTQAQGALPLVTGGESAYVIYRAPAALPSVQQAAEEIQRIVRGNTVIPLLLPASPMLLDRRATWGNDARPVILFTGTQCIGRSGMGIPVALLVGKP